MCIGYRVRVSPRRNAERASAKVRPGAAARATVTIELPPLHRIGVLDELATTALGWVIFPVVVSVQLCASVTVYE